MNDNRNIQRADPATGSRRPLPADAGETRTTGRSQSPHRSVLTPSCISNQCAPAPHRRLVGRSVPPHIAARSRSPVANVHRPAALQRDTAPQIAHPDTILPRYLANASPRSLSGMLHGRYERFPLECFLLLSLPTFSWYCTIPVLLAFANSNSCACGAPESMEIAAFRA